MHSRETVREALRLGAAGLNNCEISRSLGVPRPTIREWRAGRLPHSYRPRPLRYGRRIRSATCSKCGAEEHRVDRLSTAYVYLLGLYLGDGCISAAARGVFRLRIALDAKYPGIIDECAAAMQAVVPWNKVHCQATPQNYIEGHAYSKAGRAYFLSTDPGRSTSARSC